MIQASTCAGVQIFTEPVFETRPIISSVQDNMRSGGSVGTGGGLDCAWAGAAIAVATVMPMNRFLMISYISFSPPTAPRSGQPACPGGEGAPAMVADGVIKQNAQPQLWERPGAAHDTAHLIVTSRPDVTSQRDITEIIYLAANNWNRRRRRRRSRFHRCRRRWRRRWRRGTAREKSGRNRDCNQRSGKLFGNI